MFYIKSAYKASSIRHAVALCFTNSDSSELVVAKADRLEIYGIDRTAGSLEPLFETTIDGKIASLLALPADRITGRQKLVVVTELVQLLVLEWSDEQNTIDTVESAYLYDPSLRSNENGLILQLDPLHSVIGGYFYQGVWTGIHWNERANSVKQSFGVRLKELNVLSMCFLFMHPTADRPKSKRNSRKSTPYLGTLYSDGVQGSKHVALYSVDLASGDLDRLPSAASSSAINVSSDATFIIPSIQGGVIVVGESSTVLYSLGHHNTVQATVEYSPTVFTTFTSTKPEFHEWADSEISEEHWWLADDIGQLFLLTYTYGQLTIHLHNNTPIASKLVVLSKELLFVASHYGDSGLYNIAQPSSSPLDTLVSLSPISDFDFLPSYGGSRYITCSGAYGTSSLRIISYGVNITDEAAVDTDSKGMQAIYTSNEYLIMSFPERSRVFQILIDGEMEEVNDEVSGFDTSHATLSVRNRIQVTSAGVHNGWQGQVDTASSSDAAIVVTNGSTLNVLDREGKAIVHNLEVDGNISCVECTSAYIAIGLWSGSVQVYDLRLTLSSEIKLNTVPRSLAMMEFIENETTLYISVGDGTLLSYDIKLEQSFIRCQFLKMVTLSNLHATLVKSYTRRCIFAVCENPAMLHVNPAGKQVISLMNVGGVSSIADVNCPPFERCLVVASLTGFRMGRLDNVENMHVRSIPLKRLARRIAYLSNSKGTVTGIAIISLDIESIGLDSEKQTSRVEIYDAHSYVLRAEHSFEENEIAQSLCTLDHATENCYFAVGTGLSKPRLPSDPTGQLHIFRWDKSGNLSKSNGSAVLGTVYSLTTIAGVPDILVSGHDASLALTEYSLEPLSIGERLSHTRIAVLVVSLASIGSKIIAGDLMRCISVLEVKREGHKLHELARRYASMWMTAVEAFNVGSYIGADADGNIIVTTEAPEEDKEDLCPLVITGSFHLGEMINRLKKVSSFKPTSISEAKVCYATVDGSFGSVTQLTKSIGATLLQLQTNMQMALPRVGGLDPLRWRAYQTEAKKDEVPYCFIDGDYMGHFLDLDKDRMESIIKATAGGDPVTRSLEDILGALEELSTQ